MCNFFLWVVTNGGKDEFIAKQPDSTTQKSERTMATNPKNIFPYMACLLGLFLWLPFMAQAQVFEISGRISDAESREALAFVNILVNKAQKGTTTRIDGSFYFKSETPIQTLSLSYVGYEPLEIDLSAYLESNPKEKPRQLNLFMFSKITALREVEVVSGENPAHRIIRLAADNRKKHDPEQIPSFTFTSYNKFLVGGFSDRDVMKVREKKEGGKRISEDDLKFIEFFSDKHIFLSESVTERKYLFPNRYQDKVIANRVSGMQNPLFAILVTSFNSLGFHSEFVTIFAEAYLNPIAQGSIRKYYFALEQTLVNTQQDTTFIISFEPIKAEEAGLKGVLYINSQGYALEKVIASTTEDSFKVRMQQSYARVEGGTWFPTELYTEVTMPELVNGVESEQLAIGRSYLSDIRINPQEDGKPLLRGRDFGRDVLVYHELANKRDEAFWEPYRLEEFDQVDQITYETWDSLGTQVLKLDRLMRTVGILADGKVPLSVVDLDLNRVLQFNQYEGIRLGLGFHTSEKVSRLFNIGGYGAWGFKDKSFKYGGDVNLFLSKKNNLTFTAAYAVDVAESGGMQFYKDRFSPLAALMSGTNPPVSSSFYRRVLVENMDSITAKSVSLQFFTLKYLDVQTSLAQIEKRATSGYQFIPEGDNALPTNQFQFAEFRLSMRYAFREKYINSLGRQFSQGTKYPVVWLNFYKGFDQWMGGQFAYEKVDYQVAKTFNWRPFLTTRISMVGGHVVRGSLPYTDLFNMLGTRRDGTSWLEVDVPLTFQTMGLNEFLASDFVALFMEQTLGRVVVWSKKSEPTFALAHNMGVGRLNNPAQHTGYAFSTMEQGYMESGMVVRNIIKLRFGGYGIGVFYRYGPYAFDKPADNLVFKLSVGN
jgi:hypothetical protein